MRDFSRPFEMEFKMDFYNKFQIWISAILIKQLLIRFYCFRYPSYYGINGAECTCLI